MKKISDDGMQIYNKYVLRKRISIIITIIILVIVAIFSMGIGYVFYSSECFLFGVLAHIAERMISNLSKNRIQEYAVRHKKDQND